MKKRIAILGSTGSIGKTTLRIVQKDIKNFEIVLLTTNNNIHELQKQIKIFKPKNVLIHNKKTYLSFISKFKNKKIKVLSNFNELKKNKKKKN